VWAVLVLGLDWLSQLSSFSFWIWNPHLVELGDGKQVCPPPEEPGSELGVVLVGGE